MVREERKQMLIDIKLLMLIWAIVALSMMRLLLTKDHQCIEEQEKIADIEVSTDRT